MQNINYREYVSKMAQNSGYELSSEQLNQLTEETQPHFEKAWSKIVGTTR
jgi:hypothetical protein